MWLSNSHLQSVTRKIQAIANNAQNMHTSTTTDNCKLQWVAELG